MKVVIAGASGFIGSELMTRLPEAVGISRTKIDSPRWIKADLFSRSSCERALRGCDIAIYLVHSMLPTSHLDQGNFEDFDLIIADNFARACRINKVKQIIYLAGVIPKVPAEELSLHLKSRQEVANILKSAQVPLTTLRAGLIIGDKGSSFNILKNLSLQIPVLIYPKWLLSKMEPVSLERVLRSIMHCINNPKTFNQTYDLTSGQVTTYKELILLTRSLLNKHTQSFEMNIPNFLIKSWFLSFSDAPKNLVFPLLESLKHDMLTTPEQRLEIDYQDKPLAELIEEAIQNGERKPQAFKDRPHNKMVRSIQRINISCADGVKVYNLYFHWLVEYYKPFMEVKTDGRTCIFKMLNLPLLVLTHVPTSSENKREVLAITGGLLVSKTKKIGRIEFRKFKNCIIVALHDFKPALPWFIYVISQALVHKTTMHSFKKYLENHQELCSSDEYTNALIEQDNNA
jgi:uncharacterized protein YbjT (DUF2867 family)